MHLVRDAHRVGNDNGNGPFQDITFQRRTEKYFVAEIGEPRFNELDSYSMVWNGHYINYFANTLQMFGKYANLSAGLLEECGFQIPLYSYFVKMRNPIFANDEMKVGVRPVSFRKGLIEFSHLILVADEVRVTGNTVHAVVDSKTRSMVYPLPELVHAVVGQIFAHFKDS
jgi:acyl-CoA thioesterase FadM